MIAALLSGYPEGRGSSDIVGSSGVATLDRFTILRKLGSGGAGVVYEAFDVERGDRVALKVLRGQEPGALLRFKQEFRALQGLVHPNLVRLGELIEHAGKWFFTMEFVPGVDFLTYVRIPGAEAAKDARFEVVTLADGEVGGASARSSSRMQVLPAGPTARMPLFDEEKLRAALGQLARGLSVLHAAGKVHRDIKPANLLCTDGGRVVILDFGIVLDTVHSDENMAPGSILGTPAYMAPEQVISGKVGREADWYAVGVLLYYALSGRLPFGGNSTDMLVRKQHLPPVAPSDLGASVPTDLEALCMELLRIDPSARPSGEEVLGRLLRNRPSSQPVPAARATAELFGREAEIAVLTRALDESRTGGPVLVQISGESGIGKSALVRHFCQRMARERAALVLAGSCFERESVPYKAVDGVIDALTHALGRMPPAELLPLLPRNVEFLARMFPVLLRIEAIAKTTLPVSAAGDHHEGRRRAFEALRELWARLSAAQPLILCVDDVHWGDEDSLALLREVLHPGDAPHLLLLATARVTQGAAPRFDLSTLPVEVRHVRLDPLTADSAAALARSWLEQMDATPTALANASSLVHASGGHPLFIEALLRHASSGIAQSDRAPALEDALWSRIERLDPGARGVLELLVIAGQPIALEILAAAAETEVAEVERHVAALRAANFALSAGARRADAVELYHDRIRAAVRPHVTERARASGHGRLALALESSRSVDPEAIAQHWRDAGRVDRAAQFAEMAAVKAYAAFAFERAARLYALAIELAPDDPDRVRAWRLALGDALANAGRGREAAEIYLAAADLSRPGEALELRRRAAEQLLITGHVDAGREVMGGVLSAVGIRLPAGPVRALVAMLLRRAQLRLRGLRYRERDASELLPRTLVRIDVCSSAAMGLGYVDTISAALFQTRNVLMSLSAGEPFRVARALIMEAHFSATSGTRSARRTALLVQRAHEIAARSNDPRVRCGARAAAGIAAFCEGRWADARELLSQANRLIEEHRTGDPWDVFEIDETKIFYLNSLLWRGALVELGQTRPRMLREAEQRGDRFAMSHMQTGIQILNWLMRGDVAGARRIADETLEMCPSQGTHVPHFMDLVARAHIDLYVGDAASAHERALEWWPRLRRALLLEVQYLRVSMLDLVGRTALARAAATPGSAAGPLVRQGLRVAAQLRRERVPWATALAEALLACAAEIRGDPKEAVLEALSAVAKDLDDAGMALHAAAARRRLGRATGGEEGRSLVTAADAWMAEQGIVDPANLTEVILPG